MKLFTHSGALSLIETIFRIQDFVQENSKTVTIPPLEGSSVTRVGSSAGQSHG